MNELKLLTMTKASEYLKKKHGISISSSGLRRHLPNDSLHISPPIRATQLSIGIWVTTAEELDTFAVRYRATQTINPRLGRSGRKKRG